MLPPEAVELIESLPDDNRQAVEGIVRMVAMSHQGPLPDGETLEHYTRLIPKRSPAVGETHAGARSARQIESAAVRHGM